MNVDVESLMELISAVKQECLALEEEIRARADLSPAEYTCLCSMPTSGEIGAGPLARLMELSPSRASRVVERLARRGLLLRAASDSDRRVSRLRLSTSGRALRRKVEALRGECETRLRERLPSRELAQVRRGLGLLLEGLTASRAERPAGRARGRR
jgi:DNA-binding MarR family transcriptional regulator